MAALGQPGIDAAMGARLTIFRTSKTIMDGPGTQPFQFAGFQGFDEYNFRGPQEFSRFDFQDTQKFTDEGVMDDYMSPYMQNVRDRKKVL